MKKNTKNSKYTEISPRPQPRRKLASAACASCAAVTTETPRLSAEASAALRRRALPYRHRRDRPR